ncbi:MULTISPECIES: DUF397 domain-containing protein [Actinosynnema]|uniref:DUF397 domain-containing protein n=1 Tax=Actinosynnema TaxID=40566 RepID=UPI0020A504F6|nr:DUF397 domain-containing protein [Actinosynnema pretiosum]MCP2097401.1 protein of unknown function (DUF397) [Actinosynnema pretiosum]
MNRDRDAARVLLSATPGRKSTRSTGGNSACVAVAAVPGLPWVGLQDTKLLVDADGTRPTLVVPTAAFRALVRTLT